PARGRASPFAAALPAVASKATKNPTERVAIRRSSVGSLRRGPVAWRQVTIAPPEPQHGARLGLCSRRSAKTSAIAAPAVPPALAACASALLGIVVQIAVMVVSRGSGRSRRAQLARERVSTAIDAARQGLSSVDFARFKTRRRKKSQIA